MRKYQSKIALLFIVFVLLLSQVAAAAAPNSVKNIRFSQTPEKIRVVVDLAAPAEYTASLVDNPLQLKAELAGTQNKSGVSELLLKDDFVKRVTVSEDNGKLKISVDLNMAVKYQIFTLKNPNRLVIDLIKSYDHKLTQEVSPGLNYTYWMRSTSAGPILAYIVDVDPKAGYTIRPALSNDAIVDLETLSSISARNQAVAGINASYFAPNGELIGLLKMDGEIASVPNLTRTAVGIFADGHMVIDQAEYQGMVEFQGNTYYLSGVNSERGTDGLVLYNKYFGTSTATNQYGCEYVITNGKVAAVNQADTKIPEDGIILSVHGKMAQAFAKLKVGDPVTVKQTLNPVWDKAKYVIGVGPRLVKNGEVFVTTKAEDFGPDVASGRAPRTALGITGNGHILLVVVDGRQAASTGFTLTEMAKFMKELGAVDALNFDGGGSSEMVIKGEIKNSPSDGHERNIGDALLVIDNKLAN